MGGARGPGAATGIELLTLDRAPHSKRWRNAEMALTWTAAGLLEGRKTFRRRVAMPHSRARIAAEPVWSVGARALPVTAPDGPLWRGESAAAEHWSLMLDSG